jgi:hypothetical protein
VLQVACFVSATPPNQLNALPNKPQNAHSRGNRGYEQFETHLSARLKEADRDQSKNHSKYLDKILVGKRR